MSSPIIDLQDVTPDQLRPTDNPVLVDAICEATGQTLSADGAGYNNHGFDNKL